MKLYDPKELAELDLSVNAAVKADNVVDASKLLLVVRGLQREINYYQNHLKKVEQILSDRLTTNWENL